MRLGSSQEFKRLTRFLGSYIGSGGALLTSSIATFLTFALLARSMGHEQFAINATITALTTVGVQVCGLGSAESLVRRVAQNPAIYPEMLGHVHVLNFSSGMVLILIGLIGFPLVCPVSEDFVVSLAATALILVTNIVLLKIVWLATSSYIAHSNFAAANKIEILFATFRMSAAVLGCLVFNVSTVVEWAIWNFAAHICAAMVAIVAISRLGKPKFTIVREEIPIGAMFASQLFFKAVRNNADVLLLSAVAGSEIIGSYSIARRLMEASYLSVEALNRILYPGSAVIALKGVSKLFERSKRTLVATVCISVASACFVWFITPLLPLLFGEEYVSLPALNRFLCWAVIPVAISASAFEGLGALGLQNIRAKISNTSSVVAVALVALATWQAGVDGIIVSLYAVEIVVALIAWRSLSLARDRKSLQPPSPHPDGGQALQMARAD